MRAALLVLLLVLAPTALASHRAGPTREADPDCEDQQLTAVGVPGVATLCEGEHWDGQDATGASTPCSGAGPDGVSHRQCASNGASTDASGRSLGSAERQDVLDPVGVRATRGDGSAYVAANAFWVGEVVLFARACAGCSVTIAAYAEDASPGNLWWTLLMSVGRVTRPNVSDGDCDQETYEHDRAVAPGMICGRDNTAVTLELLP